VALTAGRPPIFLAVLLALALPAGLASLVLAFAGPADLEQEPRLERVVDELVVAGAPGALVLVRTESETMIAAAGLADRELGRAMRPADRFRVGSVTKTLVATVVLQLAAEGRLRLDDSVERWVPGLVPNGGAITLRHLLQHTSGLGEYVDDPRVKRGPARGPRALVRLAVSDPPAFEPPGARFSYSSTNYLVLQLVVEAATRSPLARELERRIFSPLGLQGSAFAPFRVAGPHARGYRAPSHEGVVTGEPVPTTGEDAAWAWGAGAIVSNADELARFFSALLRGELLDADLLRDMQTVVPAGRNRYGLGLAAFPTPCGTAWGHTGNVGGYVTIAWNTRNASRQLVLMINTYPLTPELEAALRHAQTAAFCGSGAGQRG
jgi:D-alanyl-D-alanine carboxypeptidase